MSKPDPNRDAPHEVDAEVIAEHLLLDALPDAFARLAAGTDAVKISIDTQGGRMYD